MEISAYAIAAVVGYLFGSVSAAVLLCRLFGKTDVRTKGSKNAGATNVARVYGARMGLLTFLFDIIKTCIAMTLGGLAGALLTPASDASMWGMSIAAIGCIIGHCWPVFFGFKGGKGVSVSAAIALLIDWRLFLLLIAVFIVVVLITKRVSVGSLASAVLFVPVELLLGDTAPYLLVIGSVLTVVVVLMHMGNIKRLINGTEPAFTLKKGEK
ncbi:MAG: glycerol-3-phosphate 1-O-acyltransferase PlsY [Clostridia bacterium]|nr:glycerol-3-phosphate 1-O-acyltransferase PlsY [Clostridia bacterium]